MKKKKIAAISLASLLMASVLALPTNAAKASFTPNSSNFVPIFDFDKTPTAQYQDGYNPGGRRDTIGDSKDEKCIKGDGVGLTYQLTIQSGIGYSGKALKDEVLSSAPQDGSWCPVALNSCFGENKNPGVTSGKVTDFVFWIDVSGFNDTDNGENGLKGILLYIQETDFDDAGNPQENATAWEPTSGSPFYYEDGNGGWSEKAVTEDRDFYLPYHYKGWVRLPLTSFTYTTGWGDTDVNKKFDCKKIQQINLGMGNYKRQIGSVIVFDEFGFMLDTGSSTTTKDTTAKTTTTKANETTAATTTAETTTTAATTAATSAAITTATKTSTTAAAGDVDGPNNNNNNTPWAIIIPIIIVVVLGGAGTGVFFFYKKIKNDGYSSFADYFKNRKNSSDQ